MLGDILYMTAKNEPSIDKQNSLYREFLKHDKVAHKLNPDESKSYKPPLPTITETDESIAIIGCDDN